MTSLIRSWWFIVCIAFVASCGDEGGLLIVTLSASPAINTNVVGLDVTAGGVTRHHDINIDGGTLTNIEVGIQLPPSALGNVTVVASAADKTAMGSKTVAKGGVERITLSFGTAPADLAGMDLVGVDLAGIDGAGIDIANIDLPTSPDLAEPGDLAGADLTPGSVNLTADPTSIPFGNIVASGTGTSHSASVHVTITNSGTAAANGLTVNVPASFGKENDTCNAASVAAGDHCTLDVYFAPTTTGAANGQLTVSGGGSTAMVSLSGTGVSPGALTSTPPNYTWTGVIVNQTDKRTFTITNTGGSPTGTLALSLTSSKPGDSNMFVPSNDNCSNKTLQPSGTLGDHCAVDITFAPTAKGSYVATLTATDGTANLPISLSGTGLTPITLGITGTTTFPDTPTGKVSSQHFIITNDGDVDALNGSGPVFTVTLIQSGTVYSIKNNSCGSGIAAHTSCGVDVEFKPVAAGANQTATLHANFNNASMPSADASLSGNGITPAALSWTQPATTNPFTFAAVPMGAAAPQQIFRLKNSGDEVVTTINATLSGDAAFSIDGASSTCQNANLGKNQTCDVVVKLATNTAQASPYTTTLNIASAVLAANFTATINGTVYSCVDSDGDGHFTDAAHCGGTADCNDNDADNWDLCGSCKDNDGDGFFNGCNRYGYNTTTVHLPDCNDGDHTFAESPREPGKDNDCDANPDSPTDTNAIFVAQVGTLNPGNDSNPGTQALPVATIGKAITLVGGMRRTIVLAQGSITESFLAGTTVPGTQPIAITFLGGYSPGAIWGPPNPGIVTTVQSDALGTITAQFYGSTPPAADYTRHTIIGISNIVLVGGPGAVKTTNASLRFQSGRASAINPSGSTTIFDVTQSNLTIADSIIEGGTASSAGAAVGIRAGATTLTIANTFVNAVKSGFPSQAIGVQLLGGCSADIGSASFIDPVGASGSCFGLDITGSTVKLSSDKNGKTTVSGGSSSNNSGGPRVAIQQRSGDLTLGGGVAVYGGDHGDYSQGLNFDSGGMGGSLKAWGSTIDGGTGDISSRAVFVDTSGSVSLANLLITPGTSGGSRYGIVINNVNGGIALINNIFAATNGNGTDIQINPGTGTIDLISNAFEYAQMICWLADGAGCQPPAMIGNGNFQRAGTSSGNLFSANCNPTQTGNIANGSGCQNKGVDPRSIYGLPSVQRDLDGEDRPQGTWDIGPDEIP